MDFYILAKSLTYLFLTVASPTTLVFNEPIEYISAGKNGDVTIHRSNNKMMLVVQPLKELMSTNMIVITKNNHFQFRIQTSDRPHNIVYVYPGKVNTTFLKRLETADFRILEGDSSVLVLNRSDSALKVNDQLIEREQYFSKGVPLFINEHRILN